MSQIWKDGTKGICDSITAFPDGGGLWFGWSGVAIFTLCNISTFVSFSERGKILKLIEKWLRQLRSRYWNCFVVSFPPKKKLSVSLKHDFPPAYRGCKINSFIFWKLKKLPWKFIWIALSSSIFWLGNPWPPKRSTNTATRGP